MSHIRIQVCFAMPDRQIRHDLEVPDGTSLREAIQRSEVLREAPELDLSACQVGIYGKLRAMDTALRDRDRVEIYRPLKTDPKESRRRRADKKGKKIAR